MPSDRQFIRFAIPGWVFTLYFIFLLATGGMVAGDMKPLSRALHFGQTSIGGALLIAGAGIPLGYIIYQVYFLFRWSGRITRFSSQRPKAVVERTLNGISEERLTMSEEWRKSRWREIANDYQRQWNYVDGLWREFIASDESLAPICIRADELMDTFHALGASMWACILAFLLHIFYVFYLLHRGEWTTFSYQWAIFWVLLPTLETGVVVCIIYRNRHWAENRVIDFHNYFLKKHLLEAQGAISARSQSEKPNTLT